MEYFQGGNIGHLGYKYYEFHICVMDLEFLTRLKYIILSQQIKVNQLREIRLDPDVGWSSNIQTIKYFV